MSLLRLLHKIYYSTKYPLHSSLPDLVFAHNTGLATAANSIPFSSVRFNIVFS